jgi:uncharacterized protein YpmS
MYILKKINLINFTNSKGDSLNRFTSPRFKIKQKDDSLLFTGNLSSLSSKIHIKLNTHPLVLNFGTLQHIPKLSSHAQI